MQIKVDQSLRWPKKLKSDLRKQSKNKYCRFHHDHRHDTHECYDLKQKIEALIKHGKLKNFIRQEQKDEQQSLKNDPRVRVDEPPKSLSWRTVIVGESIAWGSFNEAKKTYLQMVQTVQIIGCPSKQQKMDKPSVSFIEEDVRQFNHPHDDDLAITLRIVNFTTRRILVNNGSSVDIHYYSSFQHMRIDKERLHPVNTPLAGFGGTEVYQIGSISLQVVIGSYTT